MYLQSRWSISTTAVQAWIAAVQDELGLRNAHDDALVLAISLPFLVTVCIVPYLAMLHAKLKPLSLCATSIMMADMTILLVSIITPAASAPRGLEAPSLEAPAPGTPLLVALSTTESGGGLLAEVAALCAAQLASLAPPDISWS